VLRAQKDAAALADVVLSQKAEVASKTQALQALEQNHQLTIRYHEQGSNQQMNQKDRLFDEMAAARSSLEHECNVLKSELARSEQTTRKLNVGRSDIHAEMLRHESRASSLGGEHASMARRLRQLESMADLHHTRVEMMVDKANEKASHLSEELVQERGVSNLLESDIASLQAEMQQKWEERREYEQWFGSRQLSPEKPKERTETWTVVDLPFRSEEDPEPRPRPPRAEPTSSPDVNVSSTSRVKTKEADTVIVPAYPNALTLYTWKTSLMRAVIVAAGKADYDGVLKWICQSWTVDKVTDLDSPGSAE
jgi:hypothetical protein